MGNKGGKRYTIRKPGRPPRPRGRPKKLPKIQEVDAGEPPRRKKKLCRNALEGFAEGNAEGVAKGVEGLAEGVVEGVTEGVQGFAEGVVEGAAEGVEGFTEGVVEGAAEGVEGFAEGVAEDVAEGVEGFAKGVAEGENPNDDANKVSDDDDSDDSGTIVGSPGESSWGDAFAYARASIASGRAALMAARQRQIDGAADSDDGQVDAGEPKVLANDDAKVSDDDDSDDSMRLSYVQMAMDGCPADSAADDGEESSNNPWYTPWQKHCMGIRHTKRLLEEIDWLADEEDDMNDDDPVDSGEPTHLDLALASLDAAIKRRSCSSLNGCGKILCDVCYA